MNQVREKQKRSDKRRISQNIKSQRRARQKGKNHGRLKSLAYEEYHLDAKEWLNLLAQTVILVFIVGYLFYNSWFAVLLLIPFLPLLYHQTKKSKIQKRKEQLTQQFKDAIVLLYSSVSTGSTLEQAFCKTADSLLLSYQPEDDICREFARIRRKLDMNVTIEECMEDFAQRSGLDDIENFSQVIAVAKRGGGSMTAIIQNSVETIKVKIESENEIRTMISAESSEFKIMMIVPAAVLLYLRLFSAGFLDVLYGNLAGFVFMTVCLFFYGLAVFWGFRILDIRV